MVVYHIWFAKNRTISLIYISSGLATIDLSISGTQRSFVCKSGGKNVGACWHMRRINQIKVWAHYISCEALVSIPCRGKWKFFSNLYLYTTLVYADRWLIWLADVNAKIVQMKPTVLLLNWLIKTPPLNLALNFSKIPLNAEKIQRQQNKGVLLVWYNNYGFFRLPKTY